MRLGILGGQGDGFGMLVLSAIAEGTISALQSKAPSALIQVRQASLRSPLLHLQVSVSQPELAATLQELDRWVSELAQVPDSVLRGAIATGARNASRQLSDPRTRIVQLLRGAPVAADPTGLVGMRNWLRTRAAADRWVSVVAPSD